MKSSGQNIYNNTTQSKHPSCRCSAENRSQTKYLPNMFWTSGEVASFEKKSFHAPMGRVDQILRIICFQSLSHSASFSLKHCPRAGLQCGSFLPDADDPCLNFSAQCGKWISLNGDALECGSFGKNLQSDHFICCNLLNK